MNTRIAVRAPPPHPRPRVHTRVVSAARAGIVRVVSAARADIVRVVSAARADIVRIVPALLLVWSACSHESSPGGDTASERENLRQKLAPTVRDELRDELRPVVLEELRRELGPDATSPSAPQPLNTNPPATKPPPTPTPEPTRPPMANPDPNDDLWNRPGTTIWPSPGGLRLVELSVGTGLEDKLPIGIESHYQNMPEILYCYTVFENPWPDQTITHVWRRSGRLVSKVELEVGKSPKWRTWSKQRTAPHWRGVWSCEVLSSDGTQLGLHVFQIGG